LIFALLLTVAADIEAIAKRIDSVVGVSAKNVVTGKRVDVRADERFPMGSVYKLPIGIEVLHQVDAGRIDLSERITIRQFSPGHSPIRDKAAGKPVTMTVQDLLVAMVRDSDNTACDVLLRRVSPANVTARMRAMNGAAIRVDRTEKQIAADIRKHGERHYASDPRDTATPRGMVAMLEALMRERKANERIVRMMIDSPRNRIRVALPENIVVGHKSGQMPGTRNDVGFIDAPGGATIVIAVFTKGGVTSREEERAEVISAIAKRVYEELSFRAP
jgi:beta-lactamase class A